MTDQKLKAKRVNTADQIMSQGTLERLNATSSGQLNTKVDQGTSIVMAVVQDD